MTPLERADYLATSRELKEIHTASSLQGQTAAPDADEDMDLHFVAFVASEGVSTYAFYPD